MPPPHNQRSALSLVGGTLYVAYGGHVGDCGPYHGWVIGINTQNPTTRGGWATGGQGEGIWAAGGMASDGNGVFAVTGNRTGSSSSTHQDSEEVVRITGTGTRADLFYPTSWMAMDQADADFGSVNPLYVELPGRDAVEARRRDREGRAHVPARRRRAARDVDRRRRPEGRLHGRERQHGDSHRAGVVPDRDGPLRRAVDDDGRDLPSGSGVSGRAVVSVRIAPGNPPTPTVAWCAPMSSPTTGPIATTTDGQANAIVWYMSGGRLMGVDGDTGASIYASATSDTCSGIRQWSSPIAVKGRIVAGGDTHLCSWSVP